MRNVTDSTFQAQVLDSAKPVLVKFGAEWCGPCRMIAPVLEEILAQESASFDIVSIDVDEAPQVSAEFGIQTIPTMILFKDGQKVDQFGTLSKHDIIDRVKRSI
ncbi:MAG: thioredoxin [Alphaproteobacteria bacterium]|nr:thioredoxin [Alphaproteobacteria bacterium]